jgi:hypothetical protein
VWRTLLLIFAAATAVQKGEQSARGEISLLLINICLEASFVFSRALSMGLFFSCLRVESFVGAAAGIILLNIRGVAAVEPLITFANHCSSLKCLLPRSQWSIVFFHYYIPAPSKGKEGRARAFLSLSLSCTLAITTIYISLPLYEMAKIFSPRGHTARTQTPALKTLLPVEY